MSNRQRVLKALEGENAHRAGLTAAVQAGLSAVGLGPTALTDVVDRARQLGFQPDEQGLYRQADGTALFDFMQSGLPAYFYERQTVAPAPQYLNPKPTTARGRLEAANQETYNASMKDF